MVKAAYFHSIGGASGDMALAALVDAGLPLPKLEEALDALRVPQIRLNTWRDQRCKVSGTRIDVEVANDASHSIDDFIEFVQRSDLPEIVQEQATAVFRLLGNAETAVHGNHKEPVKLQELGSLDTLVDVVGVVAGLHILRIERVYASPLILGSGTVETSHGKLPVPGPATAHLIVEANAPVSPSPQNLVGELTTPTGAALLTALATFEAPALRVESIGYGLGTRNFTDFPNALGVWLGELSSETASLILLETNIDDSTPEILAYVQELLMDRGALDSWLTPINMKKGRSGSLLSVLGTANLEPILVDTILRETTTLGVRTRLVRRYEATREIQQVRTSLGTVRVKVKFMNGIVASIAPEYEDCRLIAKQTGSPLREVYRLAEDQFWSSLDPKCSTVLEP